jgi:hypothetical protein
MTHPVRKWCQTPIKKCRVYFPDSQENKPGTFLTRHLFVKE